MQLSYAVLASIFAAVAYSQSIADDVAQIPSCATSCLLTGAQSAGCSITDYACQCGSAKNAITASATPCVLKACSSADALKVQTLTGDICSIQAASGSSAAGSSSASSAAPASSSSVASSVSSSMSSSMSSASGAASSASSSVSSKASSASSAGSSASSSAASRTSSAASSSSSAAAATTSNAASNNKAGALVAGAAALVAFAL